jgi:hypothetical protein
MLDFEESLYWPILKQRQKTVLAELLGALDEVRRILDWNECVIGNGFSDEMDALYSSIEAEYLRNGRQPVAA